MASKMVSDQRKNSVRVAGSALDVKRANRAMQGVMTRFADVLPEGRHEITVAEAQVLLGRQLEHQRSEAVRKDDAHFRELLDDYEIRVQRDEAAAELYEKMSGVRNLFEGQYGKGSSIIIFGLSETAKLLGLHRSNLYRKMKQLEMNPPDSASNGDTPDAAATEP